jgi:hypothetical protein
MDVVMTMPRVGLRSLRVFSVGKPLSGAVARMMVFMD